MFTQVRRPSGLFAYHNLGQICHKYFHEHLSVHVLTDTINNDQDMICLHHFLLMWLAGDKFLTILAISSFRKLILKTYFLLAGCHSLLCLHLFPIFITLHLTWISFAIHQTTAAVCLDLGGWCTREYFTPYSHHTQTFSYVSRPCCMLYPYIINSSSHRKIQKAPSTCRYCSLPVTWLLMQWRSPPCTLAWNCSLSLSCGGQV